jgi:hypothetical protein
MQTVLLQLGNAKASLDGQNSRLLLGRDPSCAVVAVDGSVSRRHAEVFLEAGQVYIRDLGSSNGTWVDGVPITANPVALRASQQVFVGHVPLKVEWQGAGGAATVMGEVPAALKAMMEARRSGHAAPVPTAAAPYSAPVASAPPTAAYAPPTAAQAAPAAPLAQSGLGLGGKNAPLPSDFAYRRQGSNNNGVLLIALKGDTFANNTTLDGYLEFTALDNETIASITVELVEVHRKQYPKGHVWDRMLVRQGPWNCKKNEVVPMPFQLRVPNGTSMSGKDTWWEIRGYVDIEWAFDVAATSPITMRNSDIERFRDALGSLDYRIVNLDAEAKGQRFTGTFQPPTQLRSKWGISDINLEIEYLGSNLKVLLEVEKTSLFKFDKRTEMVFDIQQLRTSPLNQISAHFQQEIDKMMGK